MLSLALSAVLLASGSLVAPILAHASINAFGLLVAATTQRSRSPGGDNGREDR